MRRFAETLRDAQNAIFGWSMGLTQHTHGVDTVAALLNVGLARGYIGREKAGLMPIRGHSGVQGGAEVGCSPGLDDEQRERFEAVWGFPLPSFKGLAAADMVEAAGRGEIDVLWTVGGNFLETLPEPEAAGAALGRVGTRLHQDIVLSSMMLEPPQEAVVDPHVHEVPDDRLDVAADVPHLGELGRLDLHERRPGEPRQAPRDLRLPHSRRADQDQVAGQNLVAQLVPHLLAPPSVPERDGNRLLGLVLSHDVLVELGDDLPRRKLLEPNRLLGARRGGGQPLGLGRTGIHRCLLTLTSVP
jgi:hypothetical protein